LTNPRLGLSMFCILTLVISIPAISFQYGIAQRPSNDPLLEDIINQKQKDQVINGSSPPATSPLLTDPILNQILNQKLTEGMSQQPQLVSPMFNKFQYHILDQTPTAFKIQGVFEDKSKITYTIDVRPNVNYDPKAEDLAIAKSMANDIFAIKTNRQLTNSGFTYSIQYFVPYSKLPAENVNLLESLKMPPLQLTTTSDKPSISNIAMLDSDRQNVDGTFYPNNNIKPVISAMAIRGAFVKAVAIYEAVDEATDWISLIKYGKDAYDRINQIEQLEKCKRNPKIKPYVETGDSPLPLPEQSRENIIHTTKVEIAANMLLTGITIAATTFISGVNEVEIPKLNSAGEIMRDMEGKVIILRVEKTTNAAHAIAFNRAEAAADDADDVFKQNMDHQIDLAKRIVGECEKDYVGKLKINAIADPTSSPRWEQYPFGEKMIEEYDGPLDHVYNLEFKFLIDKNNKLIGNGKGVLTIDKSKYFGRCPPNQANVDVSFKMSGEYNPTRKVARMAIIEPVADTRNEKSSYFERANIGSGGYLADREGHRARCTVDKPGNAAIEYLLLARLFNVNRHFIFIDLSTVPTKGTGFIKTPLGDVQPYRDYDFKSIEYEVTVCNRVANVASSSSILSSSSEIDKKAELQIACLGSGK